MCRGRVLPARTESTSFDSGHSPVSTMSSQITTRCSNCETALSVDDSCFGESVRCPSCDGEFVVSVVGLGTPMNSPPTTREWTSADGTVLQVPEEFAPPRTGKPTRPVIPKPVRQGFSSKPLGRVAEVPEGNHGGSSQLPVANQRHPISRVGRFEIRETLGSGGFGVVYAAHDPLLDRRVALKIPHIQQSDERARLRFTTEAKSAARLKHPGIVAVLEAGTENGQSWIASEYVQGMTMAERLKIARPSFQLAAVWIRDLAEALAYAHSEGIVHRDIKPDNIILNQNERPQIMDFGLAKQMADDAGITRDGSIIGTPSYMSPEQARAEGDAVGPLSDQYSLAAVMYELLTGQKSFDGPAHYVIAQVATAEPARPSSLEPSIPKDLEAICLHALEKQPSRRYPNLDAMAEDLDGWLNGRETIARPLRIHERLLRWVRKSPAVAGLSLTVVLCIVVGFIAVARQWRRAESNLTDANSQRRLAEENQTKFQQQRDVARTFADEADKQRKLAVARQNELQTALALAQANLDEANRQRERAKTNLAKADSQAKRADRSEAVAEQERMTATRLRAKDFLEMGYKLASEDRPGAAVLAWAHSLATLPGEPDMYSNLLRSNLSLYSLQLNQLLGVLPHDGAVTCCAVESQGRFVLTGSADKKVRLWNAVSGQLLFEPIEHDQEVSAVAFSPDGKRFLICSGSEAKLWDLASGEVVGKPWKHSDRILAAAFSHDGSRVITGCADRTARIWNPSKGRTLTTPLKHAGQVHAVALSPDGKLALTATSGIANKLVLWNALNGKPIALLAETKQVITSVAISRDGKWFATGSEDGTARIWNARTGQPANQPLSHRGPVRSVAFAENSTMLLTGSDDKTVQAWSVATGRRVGQPIHHSSGVRSVAYDQAGQTIFVGGDDGALQVWQPPGFKSQSLRIPHELVRTATFSNDGQIFVTGGEDRFIRIWNAATIEPIGQPMRHPAAVSLVAVSHDGKTILSGSGGAASLWDADSQIRNVPRLKHQKDITAGALSPDGRITATAGADSVVRLWETKSGIPIGSPLNHDAPVVALAFNFDGSLLASASRDALYLWKLPSGEAAHEPLLPSDTITMLAFSPTDNTLAIVGSQHVIQVMDAASGTMRPTSMSHGGAVRSVAFSSDGRWLVSAGDDHQARMWNLSHDNESAILMRHPAEVTGASFLWSDRTIVTACHDGFLRLWDAKSGRPIGIPMKHHTGVNSIVTGPDGTRVVSICDDKSAFLWRIPSPIGWPADTIVLWAEVVTGMALGKDGQVRILPLDEWRQRQQTFATIRQSVLKEQK